MYRSFFVSVVLISWLLGGKQTLWAQPASSASPLQAPPALEEPLRTDTVAARANAVKARIKALGKSNLPKEDLEATRTTLEQLLKVLLALEETLQRQVTFVGYLDELPQRLRALEAERKTLETRQPPAFPKVTSELQAEYEARLQTLQHDLQELTQQTAADEIRAAAIVKELGQRAAERTQLEKELLVARSEAAKTGEQTLQSLRVELFDWKLQLQQAEMDALSAERDWLAKRGSLHDALHSLAQLRAQSMTQAVQYLKQELHTALQQQQETLSRTATHLEHQLEQANDPREALRLAVTLETVDIRQQTAEYQQQRARLGNALQLQEKRNTQTKSDADRLTSLVGKYASGEGVAQRLWRAFERLQRERARYTSAPLKDFETRLRIVTTQMLALDDRLYDFDNITETHLAKLQPAGLSRPTEGPSEQRDPRMVAVRTALEEQKTALREQQQALTALEQEYARSVALHRDYKRLLDESYLFVLTRMFWLRDADPLTWDLGAEVVTGIMTIVKRFAVFITAEHQQLQAVFAATVYPWLVLCVVFLGLPWVAYTSTRSCARWTTSILAISHTRGDIPPPSVLCSMVVGTAIWPAYLAFFGLVRTWLLPANADYAELLVALTSALYISALIWWISRLCAALFQPHGWAQQFWGLSTPLRSLLRSILLCACIAALVFLVPHHFLLLVSGDVEMAASSRTLARLLFLAFQSVIPIALGILGRRNSALMSQVLEQSRQHHGLLWRIWPLLYLLLLAGVIMIMTIDILGYRYAARFVWLRSIESLGVMVGVRVVVVPLVLQFMHWLRHRLARIGQRLSPQTSRTTPVLPAQPLWPTARLAVQCVVWLLVIGSILELWGVSVSWLLSSAGSTVFTRGTIIAITIGLTLVVVQFSKTLTEYLLQPRSTRGGVPYEAGRKLKTLAPLCQTLFRMAVVFVAAMVCMKQTGIDTGPILTGVGLLGLTVGLAAQSLIKDIINGLFFLFEDSLSVGDVVSLRGLGGQVEKVTLRAVTLRDLEGKVHVIPNSAIEAVTNMTKDYAYYVLDVSIGYHQDIDTVVALLRDMGATLRQDAAYARDILAPLEIMGLERFAESAMIIRTRMKTRPMQQWRVGRELNRRLKKVFDAHGIDLPFPQQALTVRPPKEGTTVAIPMEKDRR